jgi:DNA repair protein RadC
MKKQFAEHGAASMSDIQFLEMLLFYAIPRRDTNVLAHALLDRFNSLRGVLDADPSALERVEGIGENAAIFLKTVREALRRYTTEPLKGQRYILSSSDAGEYFVPILQYETEEKAYLMCLDARGRIISCSEVASGTLSTININIRQIVDDAVRRRCTTVILAHNHPNGYAFPSAEDRIFTDELKKALKIMEIRLKDHIIVADDDYVSFAQSGYI